MKKERETILTNCMEGFQKEEINYSDYEVSFRRWLISQIDSGNMSMNKSALSIDKSVLSISNRSDSLRLFG